MTTHSYATELQAAIEAVQHTRATLRWQLRVVEELRNAVEAELQARYTDRPAAVMRRTH